MGRRETCSVTPQFGRITVRLQGSILEARMEGRMQLCKDSGNAYTLLRRAIVRFEKRIAQVVEFVLESWLQL